MILKVNEKFDETRDVKNNDEHKKCKLRGERNVSYNNKILFNQQNSKKNLLIYSAT